MRGKGTEMKERQRKSDFTGRVINELKLALPSLSVNEGTARAVVAAFCAQLNPTATEIADIKCAVSEAVTNCIVHAYREAPGTIYIGVRIYDERFVRITVKDRGCGIADIKKAREPLYTTDAKGERSGMGFTVMENFMDKLSVRSRMGSGTTVIMYKRIESVTIEDL